MLRRIIALFQRDGLVKIGHLAFVLYARGIDIDGLLGLHRAPAGIIVAAARPITAQGKPHLFGAVGLVALHLGVERHHVRISAGRVPGNGQRTVGRHHVRGTIGKQYAEKGLIIIRIRLKSVHALGVFHLIGKTNLSLSHFVDDIGRAYGIDGREGETRIVE